MPLRDRGDAGGRFAKASPTAFLRVAAARLAGICPADAREAAARRADAARRLGRAEVKGGALKPGQTGDGVVALRNRLIAMGYMRRTASAAYDAEMQKAVQAFQLDHGITPTASPARAR